MYHNFSIESDLDYQTDYDKKLGVNIGNNFADTMEECFYCNPIHEKDGLYGGVPLDNIMSLPQYISAVTAVFVISKGKHPKAELAANFKLFDCKNRKYIDNDVREESSDGKRLICYRNILSEVFDAIIWGAYFLASIRAELWKEEIPVRDFLLNYMKETIGLTEEALEKHVLKILHKEHFAPTMLKILEAIKKDIDDNDNPDFHDLNYYLEHPVYSMAYDSIAEYYGIMSMKDGIEFTDNHYTKVFQEAETCVNRVLKSKYPEIEIPRVHTNIKKKYKNKESRSDGIGTSVITSDYCIGCMIEMLFMIALYDLLPEKNGRVMKALVNMRAFIENHDNSYIYTKDEMWKLVAERIPPLPGRPRIEDLQIEIERLKEERGIGQSSKELDKLRKEVAQLKTMIEGYKELLQPNIQQKYKDCIDSVFLPTYRMYDKDFPTYPQVREAAKYCIDPNEPTHIPIFIEACIAKGCARESARTTPTKIVHALIGLEVLPPPSDTEEDKRELKNYITSVGRKLQRMNNTEMTEAENNIYEIVLKRLARPCCQD